jgi:hypothetical protein
MVSMMWNCALILFTSRRWLLALACSSSLLAFPGAAQPQDDKGEWDGALWRFVLTPIDGNPHKGVLKGRFRVEKLKLYQGESGDDKEMTKLVGESNPGPRAKPTHTKVTLEDFRARNSEGKVVKGLKGVARLERDDRDHNHGKFIGEKGRHWEMKCTRIQN